MRIEKEKIALAQLQDDLDRLQKAANLLSNSYRKSKAIGVRKEYSDLELEVLDAFTSRFARVSDILIQKVFKAIDFIELEESSSILDVLHKAEKRALIESAQIFRDIRELRNEFAHEYALRDYNEFLNNILEATPKLLDSIEKTVLYCSRFTKK